MRRIISAVPNLNKRSKKTWLCDEKWRTLGAGLRSLIHSPVYEDPPSLTCACAAIWFEEASPFAQATKDKSAGRRRLCLRHRLLEWPFSLGGGLKTEVLAVLGYRTSRNGDLLTS